MLPKPPQHFEDKEAILSDGGPCGVVRFADYHPICAEMLARAGLMPVVERQ